MWKTRCVVLFPILFGLVQNSHDDGPLVESKVGSIKGLRAEDGNYSMYMGIPYATVDEKNPFGSAIPHQGFDKIFKAYNDSAICPQIEEFNNTITGTLDCLHLNIYVPDTASPSNKLPVLVWIYGGGFTTGFAGRYLYGPKYLVRHDIILVTFNYRVGPYGFMCLDTPEVPGNSGLKDQKLALEWIKDYIEAFNGDPDKITVYGMSASGVTVDLHYMYGDHRLFDKLIMHSGTAMAPWTISSPDLTAAVKLAKHLGLETNDNVEALRFLSTVDPLQLIASNQALGLSFGVCIEKEFDCVERFVNEHPYNVVGPDASNKSVLLAYNRDEFQFAFANLATESLLAFTDLFMNNMQNQFTFDSDQRNAIEATTRHFYIGDKSFSEDIAWNLGEYTSDFQFIYPTIRSVKRYVDNGCRNVYSFVFSYSGDRNFVKLRTNTTHLDIVIHADEVGYVFDVSYMDTPSEKDQLAIDRITTLWANFVKYGNPTPQPTELLPVTWKPATEDKIPYLELSSNVTVGRRHYRERMAFWDLFYDMNEGAQKGYTPRD